MLPNSTLETVTDYVSDARTLLQDKISPFRYSDDELLVAFNLALLEARRLRADLFLHHNGKVPSFRALDLTEVHMEPPFRLALVFGLSAHALSRDQEDYQDIRATTFMGIFQAMLMGLTLPPVAGGSPAGGGAAKPGQ